MIVKYMYLSNFYRSFHIFIVLLLLLIMCGDIEVNPGPDNNKNLVFSLSNMQSLYANKSDLKLSELQIMANDWHIDVLAVTETWLDSNIPDALVSITGYQKPFRRDRNKRGGGTAIYCADHLPVRRRNDLEDAYSECIWIECLLNNYNFLFAVYYRPPGQLAADRDIFLSSLTSSIELAQDSGADSIVVAGDFNDRCKLWGDNHESSELRCLLRDLVKDKGLTQIINQPTRLAYDGSPQNLLDLVITDSPNKFMECNVIPPLVKIDHCNIICKMYLSTRRNNVFKRTVWNYKKCNIDGLVEALSSAPWDAGFNVFSDIDDIATYWSSLLMQTAAEFIPNTTVTVRAREKPWVNGDLKRLIRRRNVLWRRYRRARSDAHLNTFKLVRNQAVALNRTLRLNYYTSLGEELSSSDMPNRKWWKTVRQVTGDKVCTSIPPLIENGVSLTDPCVKAVIFYQYFTSQCTQPPGAENHPLPPFKYETQARLSDMSFSIPEVKKILKSLNVNKATGPDGISIFLVKNTADVLAKPLCKLFNYSLEAGVFPSDWKTSNVVPVHKKNDAQNKCDYKPVSLLCNVSKIFERLVYNKMYSFLMENKLYIKPTQFWFPLW